VDKEEETTDQVKTHWAIALEWFPENNRSLSALIKNYLCPECTKKFNKEGKETPPESLIATIQSCCSQSPKFINERLPILEGIFRLFLRNGNQALDLNQLSYELGQLRGGDTYRTSPEVLLRILKSDRYYGLQEIHD